MPQADRAVVNNAEIADRLSALAQLLTAEKANPYKIRAYRRAAGVIRSMGESMDELVHSNADLTVYAGIGEAIAAAIREIVNTGTLASLEKLRQNAGPEIADISAHPRLDTQRVLRIYKRLGIGSVRELKAALESGEVERSFGVRMAQHVRQGLVDSQTILLYHAHRLVASIEKFLKDSCKVTRAEPAGDYRRRVEVISELDFAVEAENFPAAVSCFERFGGRTPLVESSEDSATFSLHAGPLLHLHRAQKSSWGLALVRLTGSKGHLRKLTAITGSLAGLQKGGDRFGSESALYRKFGLEFIPPELREGLDEVKLAQANTLPVLIAQEDIRGDLHTHTEASDGVDTIEDMAVAAREFGYEYVGISDHSPSLKIAHGLEPERLWENIRTIDKLNERLKDIRILKSAGSGHISGWIAGLSGRNASGAGLHGVLHSLAICDEPGAADGARAARDGQPVFLDPGTCDGAAVAEAARL